MDSNLNQIYPNLLDFLGGILAAGISGYFIYITYRKRKPKPRAKDATTFEELRSVVEILQAELEKKDKRHEHEVKTLYARIDRLTDENIQLHADVRNLFLILKKYNISLSNEELELIRAKT
jgi:hypothetical protein